MTHSVTPHIKSTWHASLVGMVLATVLAFVALYAYNARRIQAEDFALGKQNTSRSETWQGVPITAHNVDEIAQLVKRQASLPNASSGVAHRSLIAWFGNSQLHTLNQYKTGQHLAPYWMRQLANCVDCIEPLGVSLSNANPQEVQVLSSYVAGHLPLQAVIIEVEFMGFREDALRADLTFLVSDELVRSLAAYPVAKELVALKAAASAKAAVKTKEPDGGLDGDLQKRVETRLSDGLANAWPLWRDRAYLRSNLLGDLFTLRNRVFHISSQTQRKIIRPRYVKNMAALNNTLDAFHKAGVPVILYFAPIRVDKPLPYDRTEYANWQAEVAELAKAHAATCLNLQALVPAQDWGSNFGDDIDFMHFQEPGHKLLAQALLPVVRQVARH